MNGWRPGDEWSNLTTRKRVALAIATVVIGGLFLYFNPALNTLNW